jgi:hypothetical protein
MENSPAITEQSPGLDVGWPRRAWSWLILAACAGLAFASASITSFAAGFGLTAQDLGLHGGQLLAVAVQCTSVVLAAVLIVRVGRVASPVVATGFAAAVIAVSLPVSWPLRLAVLAVGAAGVAVTARREWTSPPGRLAINGLLVAVSLMAMVVASWQWGSSLRRHPTDPTPAPLWLAPVVTRVEGVIELDGVERCMVRVGDSLFVDPLRTDEFVILANAAEHPIVQPCR